MRKSKNLGSAQVTDKVLLHTGWCQEVWTEARRQALRDGVGLSTLVYRALLDYLSVHQGDGAAEWNAWLAAEKAKLEKKELEKTDKQSKKEEEARKLQHILGVVAGWD
jgi:hypothetical protein